MTSIDERFLLLVTQRRKTPTGRPAGSVQIYKAQASKDIHAVLFGEALINEAALNN